MYEFANILVEAIYAIADMLKYNMQLEEIRLPAIGGNPQTFSLMAEALAFNKRIKIKVLDISNNTIEDKGAMSVAKFLLGTPCGIVSLDLSNIGMTKHGATAIFEALEKNPSHHYTLTKVLIIFKIVS